MEWRDLVWRDLVWRGFTRLCGVVCCVVVVPGRHGVCYGVCRCCGTEPMKRFIQWRLKYGVVNNPRSKPPLGETAAINVSSLLLYFSLFKLKGSYFFPFVFTRAE